MLDTIGGGIMSPLIIIIIIIIIIIHGMKTMKTGEINTARHHSHQSDDVWTQDRKRIHEWNVTF